LCVNTIHLPSIYNVVLPERLYRTPVNDLFLDHLIPLGEKLQADAYNASDGLIVLSRGLEQYWRARGVKVPIFVIPRAVDPAVFDRVSDVDPFPAAAPRGSRLLVVCRMVREKGVAELIEIFAKFVAPVVREATLTLVGDGADHGTFVELARRLGVERRVFFAGEQSLQSVPAFLQHADIFVYTSLSETYGQVVSEAQYSGLPVVALADGMGVSQQIDHDHTGVLIETSGDPEQVKWRFAKAVLRLLHEPKERERLGAEAAARVRKRARPETCVERYYEAFAQAREHCRAAHKASGFDRASTLVRWGSVHTLLAGFGLMRKPALLNRAGARAPQWDRPGATSASALGGDPAAPPAIRALGR
jgi:glycosyltransferase involved in cell wall biosynthesis